MMIFLRVASKNWFFTKNNVQRVTIVNYTYSPFYSPFIKLLFSNYSRWMEHKTFIWLCLKVYQFCSTVPWPESLLDSVLCFDDLNRSLRKFDIFQKIRFLAIFSDFGQLFSFHVKMWIFVENMAKPRLGT